MNQWTVRLADGRSIALADPYGHECVMEEAGAFAVRAILSPINERIQVLSYEAADFGRLAEALDRLALANDYGKVWMKAHNRDRQALEDSGFLYEARIPGYFNGHDAIVMSRFTKAERRHRPRLEEEERLLRDAIDGTVPHVLREPPSDYESHLFREEDAEELAQLYSEVFPTYPYPIGNPEYLVETARTHVIYRLVRNPAGRLVAAASAETSPEYHAAEMTDFASLPSERGRGLAQYLLRRLEQDAAERFAIRCFYTIARALSFGMLRTFHNGGYVYSGTLVNNCSIAGQFETMHVLFKP